MDVGIVLAHIQLLLDNGLSAGFSSLNKGVRAEGLISNYNKKRGTI